VRARGNAENNTASNPQHLAAAYPLRIAEIVQVARFGPDALNLVFRVNGRVGERFVYRGEESGFEFLEAGRSYSFDADGGLLRLASEAYRIRLAYLFDPYLAKPRTRIGGWRSGAGPLWALKPATRRTL
jgi:hypothetical protein